MNTAVEDTRGSPPISKPAGVMGVNTSTREGPCREIRTLWGGPDFSDSGKERGLFREMMKIFKRWPLMDCDFERAQWRDFRS